MVNKNYILLAGLCSALALQPAFAQESAVWSGRDMTYRGHSYDALDSVYIPEKRMEQHREYLDYRYAFPSKPRNQWELTLKAGMSNIWGDVTSKTVFNAPKPMNALGFGLSLRKAMGYTFSWRLNYDFQNATGFDYRARYAATEKPWNGIADYSGGQIYSNYNFRMHELSLQLVAASNNIKFHKAKNTVSLHGFLGAGVMLHKTNIATEDANGNAFNFAGLSAISDVDERNSQYKEWLADAEYNYQYINGSGTGIKPREAFMGDYYLDPVINAGVGLQFKLGSRVSLQIEDKITWTGLDYLDGVKMDPTIGAGLSPDKDVINHLSVGLGFNLGNKNNSVAPLWWVNPLNHVYEELSSPRHMQLPDVVLADSDGDGVTDQFDKCPDTPNGVAVDTKGCPLDSDGDGVPDYKDKELITPTNCWPVNADGVGKCKCPEGCETVVTQNCGSIISNGVINFSNKSSALSTTAKGQLANLAAQLNADPNCKVVIEGNSGTPKVERQLAWDRVNNIIDYLADNLQVNRSRFIFKYEGNGDKNSVNFRAAYPGETGTSNVNAPYPHLQGKK